MKITDLPACQRFYAKVKNGDIKPGTKSRIPIYSYDPEKTQNLTTGHFVNGIEYSKIHFEDVPKEFRTRDFFLYALSGVHHDVVSYVKEHLGTEFDRKFFKDHIATDNFSLSFAQNCFEYMPIEYIDEEMVSCAMLKCIDSRLTFLDRRTDNDDWFFSVAKRKPNVLTQDLWILGARCFARKENNKNEFLDITPDKYKNEEYYFAMCAANTTPVMEDFPKEILTTNFLLTLLNYDIDNIKSFSDDTLEEIVPIEGSDEKIKFWQYAILKDGYLILYIPLNDERINFFISHYPEGSHEYRTSFRDVYSLYLKRKYEKQN